MNRVNLLGTLVVIGATALVPASSGAEGALAQDQPGLRQIALSLEKALPAFVSSEDYRSASNTAFLLATARSRLDQTAAACDALSRSLEYYRKAISQQTGEPQRGVARGIDEDSDGMAVVRAKFGCNRARSA